MARTEATQFNIRSRFARERAAMLAHQTGLTTEVVEEALRAYQPPLSQEIGGRLIRKGGILVTPRNGRPVSQAQADAALDDTRAARG